MLPILIGFSIEEILNSKLIGSNLLLMKPLCQEIFSQSIFDFFEFSFVRELEFLHVIAELVREIQLPNRLKSP